MCFQTKHYILLPLDSVVAWHGSSKLRVVPSGLNENVVLQWVYCHVTCTHIDDRVLKLDVEPVVRNGNNGFVSTAEIFHPFPLKNWEWHLWRHKTLLLKSVVHQALQQHT